jgi:hypothetical protein
MNKQEQYDTLFRQFIHALEENSAKISGSTMISGNVINIPATVINFIQKVKESTWKE